MVGWFSGRISLIYMQFKVLLMIVALRILAFHCGQVCLFSLVHLPLSVSLMCFIFLKSQS